VRGHTNEWSAERHEPVALSVAGRTVDDSERFVDGSAPRDGQI